MRSAGFIGYGSMGSMLLNGFLSSGGLQPGDVAVSTRTRAKLEALRDTWPGIAIAGCNAEAARAHHVFLCVKPADMKAILDEILPELRRDTHLVSIAGTVPMRMIERMAGCAVTKLVPTITSEVRGGVSLVCHSDSVNPEDAAFVRGLLSGIGSVQRLTEDMLPLGIELTSCMPGFIASIFQQMVESAMHHAGNLSRQDVECLLLQTLLGTARLMTEKGMGFDETIARVATPAGITEEGVKVFRDKLPHVFDEMFEQTLAKREAVARKVEESFGG